MLLQLFWWETLQPSVFPNCPGNILFIYHLLFWMGWLVIQGPKKRVLFPPWHYLTSVNMSLLCISFANRRKEIEFFQSTQSIPPSSVASFLDKKSPNRKSYLLTLSKHLFFWWYPFYTIFNCLGVIRRVVFILFFSSVLNYVFFFINITFWI